MSFAFGNYSNHEFLAAQPAIMQPFCEVYYEMVDDGAVFGDQEEQREKKRRLSVEQVRYLEKSFEKGSKLEPERKMQLALEVGLKPRQVAVWYQNRRARCKTKQLEKDYDILREQYDAVELKKQKLEAEVMKLRKELQQIKARLEDNLPANNNKQTDDPELHEVDAAIMSEEFYEDLNMVLDDYQGTDSVSKFEWCN